MDLYKKTKKHVIVILAEKGNDKDVLHHKRTVYWIKQLKPKADEALLIAGVSHDIERALYGDWKKGSMDPVALRKHQDLSAFEIEKFLKKQKADKSLIKRVKMLVSGHEEGGDDDQNILCTADGLAYLEDKAIRLAKNYKKHGKTKAEARKKINYVYNRLALPKAKRIAKKWRNRALNELEKK